VEREALAVTWACDKFADYLVGLDFVIETDHRPLVALLEKKALDDIPPRIMRFRLRLLRYRYQVVHIPGKEMYTADALSRAPITGPQEQDAQVLQQETEALVNGLLSNLPATNSRLEQIREAQFSDPVCQQIREYALSGWPDKSSIHMTTLKPYLPYTAEITVQDGLLMRNCRIIIPNSMQLEILEQIHAGHLGIVKCRERAKQSVWWPGLSRQIQSMVEACRVCQLHRPEVTEPLQPTPLPDGPWQKVAMDLFQYGGISYLIIVDYYSRYFEVARLYNTTATTVIEAVKDAFGRHGVPEIVRADNGPQFSCREFATFAQESDFMLITSSPRFPRSNGEAERAVRTAKALLRKNKNDMFLGLLAHRSTPLQNGYSPAELLFNGRRIRTTLVQHPSQLQPRRPPDVRAKEEKRLEDMKVNYDRRHRVQELPPLMDGDPVVVRDTGEQGTATPAENAPRSYVVQTPQSTIRRNRAALTKVPDKDTNTSTTRSGRAIKPPTRLDL